MDTENISPYVRGKSEAIQDRALKIALLLSVLTHVVLGAYLFHWQPRQKTLPPLETKIQLKLAEIPVTLSQPINPVNQMVAVADPIAQQRGPAAEFVPVQTIAAAGGPAQAEKAEAFSAPAAQANTADVIAAFLARLEQRKEYPYIARKRGQTGTVTIQIRIAPDGGMRSATIVVSSGVAVLDNAAIALARQSCPFRHETGEELIMTVSINYNLQD